MKQMNLLPEDLRPKCDRRRRNRLVFRVLLGVALLFAAGYAYLTVENARLEAYIETECSRIDSLVPVIPVTETEPAAIAPADPASDRPRLVREIVEKLDGCVPPGLALTELHLYGDTGEGPASERPVPAPPPQKLKISGVSDSGRAIGYFLTALREAGPFVAVELESLQRREDGEFAFTVLGRLSL